MSIDTTEALSPGQWHIPGVKFGRGTPYPVSDVQMQSYNVNAQDYQVIRSDEVQFGQDNFQAAPIIFELGIFDFKPLPNMQVLANNVPFDGAEYDGLLYKFANAWRADYARSNYGELVPLRHCEPNGDVKVIYGRPRKFQASKGSLKGSYRTAHAEFQRSDTYAYAEEEQWFNITQSADPAFIIREKGDVPAWLRIVGIGPLTNPVITVGDQEIALDVTLAEDELFEVSSYPWARRAIDSNGRNLAAKLIGNTQYLDRLVIPANQPTPVRWTASNVGTWVPTLDSTSWSNSMAGIQSGLLRRLGPDWTKIRGESVVRFDAFNPYGQTLFIGGTWIGKTSAILYARKQFGTSNQYAEARLVECWMPGSSGIVIMSNSAMTNFACVQVVTNQFGSDTIRIRTGTGPTTTVERASYNIGRNWSERDIVGIGYDPATKTYQAYLNHQPLPDCQWADPTGIVNTANRYQGFLFDMNATFLSIGTGFANVLAYDRATVPAPVGQIAIAYRDAYSAVL